MSMLQRGTDFYTDDSKMFFFHSKLPFNTHCFHLSFLVRRLHRQTLTALPLQQSVQAALLVDSGADEKTSD